MICDYAINVDFSLCCHESWLLVLDYYNIICCIYRRRARINAELSAALRINVAAARNQIMIA